MEQTAVRIGVSNAKLYGRSSYSLRTPPQVHFTFASRAGAKQTARADRRQRCEALLTEQLLAPQHPHRVTSPPSARRWNRRPCGSAPAMRSLADGAATRSAAPSLRHFAAFRAEMEQAAAPIGASGCGVLPAQQLLAPQHPRRVTSPPSARRWNRRPRRSAPAPRSFTGGAVTRSARRPHFTIAPPRRRGTGGRADRRQHCGALALAG